MSDRPIRCFVAVLLPDRVRAGLAAVSAELRGRAPGLVWVQADNLHLTLRFLGEVEPATLKSAGEAVTVAAAAVAPFTVTLGGLGGFPPGRAPRVVWAGVVGGSAGLGALHAGLEAALLARGIPERAGPSTLTSRWPGLASPGGWEGSLACWARGPASGRSGWRLFT